MLRFIHSRLNLNQKGDTIAEVMIATIIIASLMVGGYALSNRSLISEQEAEERSEAAGLLQGQFELMRAYLIDSGDDGGNNQQLDGYTTDGFCMNINAGKIGAVDLSVPANANDCQFNNSYQSGSPAYKYQITITPQADTNTPPSMCNITYPSYSGICNFNGVVTWGQDGGGTATLSFMETIYGDS